MTDYLVKIVETKWLCGLDSMKERELLLRNHPMRQESSTLEESGQTQERSATTQNLPKVGYAKCDS
jgi:hypothetical protein